MSMENNLENTNTQTEVVTLETINNNIVILNNNIVMFGTALLFILGVIVAVSLGKVISLWKR